MYRAIFALYLKEDRLLEEVRRYREEGHTPIATEGVPGLRKYSISLSERGAPVDRRERV